MLKSFAKHSGYTILELLISILITTFITISISQCYLLAKQSFLRQDALMQTLSNKLTFYHTVGNYIHTAGNLGCSNVRSFMTILNDEPLKKNLLGEYPVEVLGYQQLKRNPLINQSTLSRMNKSQPILWAKSLTQMRSVISLKTGKAYTITVPGSLYWPNGSKLMLSDCSHGVIVTLIDSRLSGPNTVLNVVPFDLNAHHFNQYANIGLLESTLFYIGDTGRTKLQDTPIHALYRLNIPGISQEIVEDVDAWEFSFATQDNPNRWFKVGEQMAGVVIKLKAKVFFSAAKKSDKQHGLVYQASSFIWYLKSWA